MWDLTLNILFLFAVTASAIPSLSFHERFTTCSIKKASKTKSYQYIASPANRTFDYVIIGGGNTGLVVAARLAEDPRVTVAVVEAGGFYDNSSNGNRSFVPGYALQVRSPEVAFAIPTTPQTGLDNRVDLYDQGMVVGGSTVINLNVYHRSVKGAHDRWAKTVGDADYEFPRFLPFLRKAVTYTPPDLAIRVQNGSVPSPSPESYDRNGGPVHVTFPHWAHPASSYAQQGWKSLGLNSLNDLTSGVLVGNQYSAATIRAKDQSRSSAAAFLEYAVTSARTNLFLFTHSRATKITFDGNKKARSVIAKSNGTSFELKAQKEVVVTAGAIHTPQLLMVSGIGPADTLKRHNIPIIHASAGVGSNLQDHPSFITTYNANVVTQSSLNDPAAAAAAAKEYQQKHTGLLTNNLAEYYAFERIPPNKLSSEARSKLSSLPANWPHMQLILADVGLPVPGQAVQGIAMIQAATSVGSVSISSSSISTPPILDPRTLSTKTDQELGIQAFRRLREFFNTPSMKRVAGPELRPGQNVTSGSDEQILQWLRANLSPGRHACCTAAMGKKGDKNAVVDSKGRVFGVKGLRIADASSLPFLPPGQPMSLMYGLAEKIAEDIKRG